MSNARKSLVVQAFQKLDKVEDGIITVEDLKGVYSVNKHPDFLNGKKTENELLKNFLSTFDFDGDGKVTFRLENFT
jgi:Ca2+-binding EF-hand superfamily protein